tara:strand:- start:227 stop:1216 length:990 start_codon:yes stop_codon:yes gene_type:complete
VEVIVLKSLGDLLVVTNNHIDEVENYVEDIIDEYLQQHHRINHEKIGSFRTSYEEIGKYYPSCERRNKHNNLSIIWSEDTKPLAVLKGNGRCPFDFKRKKIGKNRTSYSLRTFSKAPLWELKNIADQEAEFKLIRQILNRLQSLKVEIEKSISLIDKKIVNRELINFTSVAEKRNLNNDFQTSTKDNLIEKTNRNIKFSYNNSTLNIDYINYKYKSVIRTVMGYKHLCNFLMKKTGIFLYGEEEILNFGGTVAIHFISQSHIDVTIRNVGEFLRFELSEGKLKQLLEEFYSENCILTHLRQAQDFDKSLVEFKDFENQYVTLATKLKSY